MKLTKKQAIPITGRVFPDYRGRKFSIEFVERIVLHDTNWGGGTRNTYAAVSADGKSGTFHAPAPWANPVEGKSVEMPADVLLVEHSIFCGRDVGITIYAHPCHLPKWLETRN